MKKCDNLPELMEKGAKIITAAKKIGATTKNPMELIPVAAKMLKSG